MSGAAMVTWIWFDAAGRDYAWCGFPETLKVRATFWLRALRPNGDAIYLGESPRMSRYALLALPSDLPPVFEIVVREGGRDMAVQTFTSASSPSATSTRQPPEISLQGCRDWRRIRWDVMPSRIGQGALIRSADSELKPRDSQTFLIPANWRKAEQVDLLLTPMRDSYLQGKSARCAIGPFPARIAIVFRYVRAADRGWYLVVEAELEGAEIPPPTVLKVSKYSPAATTNIDGTWRDNRLQIPLPDIQTRDRVELIFQGSVVEISARTMREQDDVPPQIRDLLQKNNYVDPRGSWYVFNHIVVNSMPARG